MDLGKYAVELVEREHFMDSKALRICLPGILNAILIVKSNIFYLRSRQTFFENTKLIENTLLSA